MSLLDPDNLTLFQQITNCDERRARAFLTQYTNTNFEDVVRAWFDRGEDVGTEESSDISTFEIKERTYVCPRDQIKTYPPGWNSDIFLNVCIHLGLDSPVMELVCMLFCSWMEPDAFWRSLILNRQDNEEDRAQLDCLFKEGVEKFSAREFYLSPHFHWEERKKFDNITYDNKMATIDVGSQQQQWRLIKCQEPLPYHEGSIFCFSLRCDRCETGIAYIGMGILPLMEKELYEVGRNDYDGHPWLWHKYPSTVVWKTGDVLALIGCVRNGQYETCFFQNGKVVNGPYKYVRPLAPKNSSEVKLLRFPHLAIVAAERFTIIQRPPVFEYYNKFKAIMDTRI
jgi:hypothetical protein